MIVRASAALALSNDPRRLDWTVQLFTTLLASVIGVYAGTTLVPRLGRAIGGSGRPRTLTDRSLSFWIVVAAITLASLVFSEMVPRRLALFRPERIARLVSFPIRGALAAGGSGDESLELGDRSRPAHDRNSPRPRAAGHPGGNLAALAGRHQGRRLRRRRARDDQASLPLLRPPGPGLMTPRSDVVWLDIADSPDEIRAKIISSHHTRFPVCDQSLDNLLGIVQIKDLLAEDTSLEPFRIKGRLTVPLFIYEGTRGLKTLESFKKSASRVAVVLDEFGTVLGLVTLSDILQAIVGDMPVKPQSQEQPVGRAAR